METPVIVAIISSSTAILVAVLSIIWNARNQRKSMIELEHLREALSREKQRREGVKRFKSETVNALDQALEYSQKIKDAISLVTNYLKFKSKLTDEWLEKIRKEIQNYSDLFGRVFPRLPETEQNALHDMKRDLHHVDFIIARINYENKRKPIDNQELIETLLRTRQMLTDFQQSLLVRRNIYMNEPYPTIPDDKTRDLLELL